MRTGVIAKKLGMTRFFDEAGDHVPVTVLKLDGCQVTAQRTKERTATSPCSSARARKAKNTSKAERGHFAKALVEPKRQMAEFRVAEDKLIGRRRDHRRPFRRPARTSTYRPDRRQGLRRRR